MSAQDAAAILKAIILCLLFSIAPVFPALADHNDECMHTVNDGGKIVLTNHCYHKIFVSFGTERGACSATTCSHLIGPRSYIFSEVRATDGRLTGNECKYEDWLFDRC